MPKRRKAVVVKGSDPWKDWFDRGCEHCRMPSSTLVDLAVNEFFKAHGFDEPPPNR